MLPYYIYNNMNNQLAVERTVPNIYYCYLADNLGFRSSYDRIIRCMGFKFDFSIFNSSAQPDASPVGEFDKYPNLLSNYESSSVRDMFFG